MNENVNIGSRLSALRINAGYKEVKEFALHYNFSYATYRRWEIGDREPNTEDLKRLALIHDVSVDSLLGIDNIKTNCHYQKYNLSVAENSSHYNSNICITSTEEHQLIDLWRNASLEGQKAALTVLTAYQLPIPSPHAGAG